MIDIHRREYMTAIEDLFILLLAMSNFFKVFRCICTLNTCIQTKDP
jgi:hypothetical protein